MQQPHVRKAMNLGTRKMSDGLEIYKAMIEDTMQSIKKELVEAMENYKVSKLFYWYVRIKIILIFELGILFGQVLLGGENSVGVQLYKKVFAIASTSFGREVVKLAYI